jgi:flagellar hook-associated protein 3 FlgL
MRVSTYDFQRQAVQAMQDNQARLGRTELQIATGRAILTPSDDPSGAKRILDLRQAIDTHRQYQRNADAAYGRLSLEEATLAGVTDVLQRVRELALQGANSTLSRQDRIAVAAEVRERLDELLALANTRDAQGEYLFAGSRSTTLPFERSAAGGFVYYGDDLPRRLQLGASLQLSSGDSGQEVFVAIPNGNGTFSTRDAAGNTGSGVIDAGSVVDPGLLTGHEYSVAFVTNADGRRAYTVRDETAGAWVVPSGVAAAGDPAPTAPAYIQGAGVAFDGLQVGVRGAPAVGDAFRVSPSAEQDLLTTVQSVVEALERDATGSAGQAQFQNALGRALTDLDRGLDNVLRVRATVGARLNEVESQKAIQADFELFARESLSKVEDLDYAEASARLQLQLTVLQASQQAFVKVQGLSLFNYL